MADLTLATVLARLGADRKGLISDLNKAVKDASTAGGQIEEGFKRPFFKGLSSGLKESDDAMSALGSRVGAVAGLITSPWALAAGAVGLLVTALGAAIMKGLAFDEEFTKVALFLDRTKVNVDAVRQSLLALDPALGTSVQAAKVYRGAFLDTGSTEAALEITKVALALGKVLDADPEQLARLIGSLADAFGVGADQASRFGDVLFAVQQRGGGSAAELQANLGRLSDAVSVFGQGAGSIEQIGSALIALGEVSGKNPEKNAQALERALVAVASQAPRFRDLGVDVEGLQQQLGLIPGTLQALQQATGGIPAKFSELGIDARATTTLLKLMSDEGVAKLTANMQAFERGDFAGGTLKALAERSKSVSSELARLGLTMDKLATKGGDAILSFFREQGPIPLQDRLRELQGQVATFDQQIKQSALLTPGAEHDRFGLQAQKKAAEEAIGAVQELIKAQAQAAAAPAPQQAQRQTRGLTSAEEKQESEFQALVRRNQQEQLDLVAERRTVELSAVKDVQVAQARSAEARLQIERTSTEDLAKIERDRLDRRSDFLRAEIEQTRTAAGLGNNERRQKLDELAQALAQNEEKRAGAAAEADGKIKVLDAQLADERIAAADRAFAQERALGQQSLQAEIDRNHAIAQDASRTADQRLEAERRVFEGQKALREQSRSAALGLVGQAQERLQAQGQTEITRGQLEATIRAIQQERQFNVAATQSTFNTGGAVSFDALKQGLLDAGELQKFQDQAKELGSLGDIFANAFSVTGPAGESVLEFRKLFGDVTSDIIKSFSGLPEAIDASLDTINDRIAKGTARIRQTLYDQFTAQLTRDLQLEARRY